jgi:glycosyltransferase involved in cell wall biosynthesis
VSPAVSVICTAYNHERYVREAIEGFLMQKTIFPVEILISDDASTDSTLRIVDEYAATYPKLIKAVIQRENQYSRGNRPLSLLGRMARGKYVAICEGDDFWTSDAKLQTQFDMLEARPDASACVHRADGLLEPGNKLVPGMFGPSEVKSEYGIDDLICGENFVPTASIVTKRAVVADLPLWLREVPHSDIVILSIAALDGPVLYSDQSMSVYRKHPGGIHSGTTYTTQILNCLRTLVALGVNLGVATRPSFRAGIAFRMSQLESQAANYEASLRQLEDQHIVDRKTVESIMGSRTFKVGIALAKLKNLLLPSQQPTPSTVTDVRRRTE